MDDVHGYPHCTACNTTRCSDTVTGNLCCSCKRGDWG